MIRFGKKTEPFSKRSGIAAGPSLLDILISYDLLVRVAGQKGRREFGLAAFAAAFTLAAFAALASPAFAADHPQQTRMKECNVKAKGKKGDERRQFMSACLSGKDAATKKTAAPKK